MNLAKPTSKWSHAAGERHSFDQDLGVEPNGRTKRLNPPVALTRFGGQVDYACAERTGVARGASFDRSIDRVDTITGIEPR
jgi:hypothetical protein